MAGGRLSGYGAYGRNVEPAGLERATVGGGRAGRRHRIDWFVGVEPVEGEEGLVAHVVPGVARTKRSEPASIFSGQPRYPYPGRRAQYSCVSRADLLLKVVPPPRPRFR